MADNTSSGKLAALRSVLEKQGLDGLLVQRADLFQGEEVRPCDERLAYISGLPGPLKINSHSPSFAQFLFKSDLKPQ